MSPLVFANNAPTLSERFKDAAGIAFIALLLGIPMIGLTVVAFNQAYWNNHYAGQPWYGQWNSYYAGPRGGAVARGGCVGAACGGSAVVRGPYGGGAVGRGACGPDRCAGGAVVRQPGGGLEFRRGVVER